MGARKMTHQDNLLLARVGPADMDVIGRHLKEIELKHNQLLGDSHQRIERVYFPHSGIVSFVV
jgi:hypothetical protein